ncbi:MAG: Thymidylate synthase [Candidatus Methanolliviera sp. GoM_asphalt]|nr:MAG: Thymidylate synthase [Candidatus Methanolliviera sp. GoM_asphalt]
MDLLVLYGGAFGEKVLGNLINYEGFCTSCDPLCAYCKHGKYSYAQNIIGAIRLKDPATLPRFIDDPENYLPEKLPSAKLVIATDLHPDLLLELPSKLKDVGVKDMIVPIEDSHEVSGGLRNQIRGACEEVGMESSFPKPFCSLDSNEGIIKRFIDDFKIGKPLVKIETKRGQISRVTVKRSAPCGSTWFVARKLIGTELDKQKIRDVVSEAHHSYPCTASMDRDKEVGDTILHKAGYLIRAAVEEELGDRISKDGK